MSIGKNLRDLVKKVIGGEISLTFKDLQDYLHRNFSETDGGTVADALERLTTDGVLSGDLWVQTIMFLRRWEDRDKITQEIGPAAGLRKLLYKDADGVEKPFIFMKVLVIVEKVTARRVIAEGETETDRDGNPKKRVKKDKQIFMPDGISVGDLAKDGTKVLVWQPPKQKVRKWGAPADPRDLNSPLHCEFVNEWQGEDVAASAYPETDFVPAVQIRMDLDDAMQVGLSKTSVVYMPWAELVRIATALKFDKSTKEGMPDPITNKTIQLKDIVMMVPSIGPCVGGYPETALMYKRIGMLMENVIASGRKMTTIPHLASLCDPDHEDFVFRSARTFEFVWEDDEGIEHRQTGARIVREDNPDSVWNGSWKIVTPLLHRYQKDLDGNPQNFREMVIDARRGFVGLLVEYVWLMGWADQGGDQRIFDALLDFKHDVINGLKSIVSRVDDERLERAAQEDGQTADLFRKIVEKFYDYEGNQQAWAHASEAVRHAREKAWLDFCSKWRESELYVLAQNGNLTHADIEKEQWLWRHLEKIQMSFENGARNFLSLDASPRRAVIARVQWVPNAGGKFTLKEIESSLNNKESGGPHAWADGATVRRLLRLARLGELSRAAVTSAIKSDKFGVVTVGQRALLYTAQVGQFEEVSHSVAKKIQQKTHQPNRRPFDHYQLYPTLRAKDGRLFSKAIRNLFSVKNCEIVWFARPISPWTKKEMSLAEAVKIRAGNMTTLREKGFGVSTHIVAGPPLWPYWLALGDEADFRRCAIQMVAGDARSLGSTTSFLSGGYGIGYTNPEETMRLIAELIMAPWLNQQADKLMFEARGMSASTPDMAKIQEAMAKGFGAGIHPMWWLGEEWEELLSRGGNLEYLREAQKTILAIYHDLWGWQISRDIVVGDLSDLDYLAEVYSFDKGTIMEE